MSDGIYKPNRRMYPRMPLPDEIKGSPKYTTLPNGDRIITGYNIIRPNDPAPEHDPPTDKRPVKILEAAGFESAEDWGNSILAKKNGHKGFPNPDEY